MGRKTSTDNGVTVTPAAVGLTVASKLVLPRDREDDATASALKTNSLVSCRGARYTCARGSRLSNYVLSNQLVSLVNVRRFAFQSACKVCKVWICENFTRGLFGIYIAVFRTNIVRHAPYT